MKACWDEAKNLANQKQHGISFNEAQELFRSGNFLEIFDQEHSETEERFIAIGLSRRGGRRGLERKRGEYTLDYQRPLHHQTRGRALRVVHG